MIKGFPERKDSIILAAIELIDEKGIQGLSTKGIAEKQGISESLLYKHFTSIDEVLIAVVEYYSRYDDMIFNTVRKRDISSKEKIIASVAAIIELFGNYPALSSIALNYEALMRYDHTRSITRYILNKRTEFLLDTIRAAQKDGDIKGYYSPQELADIILGVIRAMILRWKMSEYSYQFKQQTLETIKKVLDRA